MMAAKVSHRVMYSKRVMRWYADTSQSCRHQWVQGSQHQIHMYGTPFPNRDSCGASSEDETISRCGVDSAAMLHAHRVPASSGGSKHAQSPVQISGKESAAHRQNFTTDPDHERAEEEQRQVLDDGEGRGEDCQLAHHQHNAGGARRHRRAHAVRPSATVSRVLGQRMVQFAYHQHDAQARALPPPACCRQEQCW